MRIRNTILLLMLLAFTAFVTGLVLMRRAESKSFEEVVRLRQAAWKQKIQSFLSNDGRDLRMMPDELSKSAPATEAILQSDLKWMEDAWDERTVKSFGAHVLWVYKPDGTLFHTATVTGRKKFEALPVPVEALARLMTRDKGAHFYFHRKVDDDGTRELVEVRGAAVFPAWDLDKREAIQGFIVAGRVLGDVWRRELLPDGEDKLSIVASDASVPVDSGASRMSYVEDLRDWQGHDLARLVVTNESAPLAQLERNGNQLFVTLVAAGFVLFACLYALLYLAVVRPLCRMIEALHHEDVTRLAPLERQKAEFGELARLITAFFEQQLTLTREMLERIHTEKVLREKDEMLQHSQKMEAVGRLAGGVAHDFNNLLTAIIGYADLLRQRFARDPAGRQPAELIHQAGAQAAGLTRQLLAFSRKQLLQPKVIDLNTIVANLHRLLQRIIGEHIEIRTALEASPACVKADPGQIEQVIVNLGVNARDAMPRGGKLTIGTVNLELSDAERTEELCAGSYIAIEVTDTGEGMDEVTRKRIFEPFFTTKGPGKGTGLGLATVYGIVRQSHGGIVVESERGRGSTFRILLPRVDAVAEQSESAPVAAARTAGAETILVVEDEEIVRELVVEILRSHGYRVLATERGSEAAEILRADGGRLDLLISDVVMPGMNGAEVARCVHEITPNARVLFVSGYSEHDMADQGLEALTFEVLQKPFTPSALARKVRDVLDGAGKG